MLEPYVGIIRKPNDRNALALKLQKRHGFDVCRGVPACSGSEKIPRITDIYRFHRDGVFRLRLSAYNVNVTLTAVVKKL